MKMKMDYRKYINMEKNVIKNNDLYLYEIEKSKRFSRIDNLKDSYNLKEIKPGDIEVYKINGKK